MSEILNWGKLKPYRTDQKKSFEQLCYQIAHEEFNNSGIFTPIDDSGGGDGVEFFLTLPNGEVWGWQVKFFCRINKGGRKEQIKKSLQTAYKKHSTLKKWFLCSKCDFTTDEESWFKNNLALSEKDGEKVLPEDSDVELIHWGDSELLDYLKKYKNILNFFFSEKLLSDEWFEERYRIDVKTLQIKAKYESKIHIPTDIDNTVNKILGGERLVEILEKEIENQQVGMYAEEYKNSLSKLFSEDVNSEYKEIQLKFREFLRDKFDVIENGIKKLEELKQLTLCKDEVNLKNKIKEFEMYSDTLENFRREYDKLVGSKICDPIKPLKEELEEEDSVASEKIRVNPINKIFNFFRVLFFEEKSEERIKMPLLKKVPEEIQKENRKRREVADILFGPRYSLKEYAASSLEYSFKVFELLYQNELHISGEAGMGKTHVSFNIYEDQIINQKQPAIFIFAKDINADNSLEGQLKDSLDIPTDWSFDDFLGALEIAAKVNKTKIPIIIDGLNESTYCDTIWRTGLERLILKIKKNYPHLVVITTYRTSYEDQLFDKNYFDYKTNKDWWKKKAHVSGFEGLTWKAIDKYFDFYKIKLDIHSNAIGDFKHPLYLKLFCEVKNPDRKKITKVSFQNEDLFEVFDEYIQKSNENITHSLKKLDQKYDTNFTKDKLLKLAEYIWINNLRGIPRSENLFTNEELEIFSGENLLVFRDWNKEENKEEIQFTYDLLGGYIISKYLIKKYRKSYPLLTVRNENIFIRLSKIGLEFLIPESGTRFLGELFMKINKKVGSNDPLLKLIKSRTFRKKLLHTKTQHPLFNDILRTISILLVKEKRIFIFDILKNKRAKQYSTESLFEINTKYIKENEHLIKKFLEKEFFNGDNRYFLFNLARNVESDKDHPVNFNFWSDLLGSLSVLDRDLSWSEYIRENHSWYGNSYFSSFVKQFEEACKRKGELSNRVHLAAKKVMWVLTTNIRKLRDEATRALYYYARKYPEEFLELLEYSLKVNDPYVSERMLAASYGLAMARQNDLNDDSYKKKWLPKYGRFIFDNMFSGNAEYTTTHILARDYAKRTIDIALLHYPDLLTDVEKELIIYPLKNYSHKVWEENEDKNEGQYRDGNAPIHMDFENYTIGRLVEGRRNYEREHIEYQKVLTGIYWRIYNLGYSLESFGEIDKQIARDGWNYSHDDNSGKTDRYGKKYSWIAFYEMAGCRSDLGLLKGWNDENEFRISDVDIDPSFPVELKEYDLLKERGEVNFLGDLSKPEKVWYETDVDLNLKDLLIAKLPFDDKKSDWALLKGLIAQKDLDDKHRDVYVSINTILVNKDDFEEVLSIAKKHNDYTLDHVEPVSDYYVFQGEFPWCDLIPGDYSSHFSMYYDFEGPEKERGTNKNEKKVETVNTVFEHLWESYHSEIISSGKIVTPSKSISNHLNLHIKPQCSNMFEDSGELASTTFSTGESFDDHTVFTYLRKDLLEKYLSDTNQKILHVQWAEKRFFANGVKNLSFKDGEREFRIYYKIYSFG